jgi:hypothetical protein
MALAALPWRRELPPLDRPYNILITGIGGTGVVTIGALLGMAAHLEGKGVSVLDFTGLAQKNGAVLSHVRIAPKPEDMHAVRIAAAPTCARLRRGGGRGRRRAGARCDGPYPRRRQHASDADGRISRSTRPAASDRARAGKQRSATRLATTCRNSSNATGSPPH